jgi:hypothetical protein
VFLSTHTLSHTHREEVEARGVTMEVRDSNMTTLQKQSHGVVDKLKVSLFIPNRSASIPC